MTGDGRAPVRLRVAAESAAGRRVLVDRDDLLAVLAGASAGARLAAAAVADLDGQPAPEEAPADIPAPRPAPVVPLPPRRGRGHVALAATVEDAKRLAEAAWDSDPDRVAAHGRWCDAEPGLTWHTVEAARRAIDHLLGGTS